MARSFAQYVSNLMLAGQEVPDDLNPEDFDNIDQIELPGEALLQQAQDVTSQMLQGEIPEDVQAQVEQISAERAIQGGFGFGDSQAARNLVARDLGLTSLDITNQGIQHAGTLAETGLKFAGLREEMRRTDNEFMAQLKDLQVKQDSLDMASYNLMSENMRFALAEANDMIISNSQKKIKNLQEHLDVILGLGEEDGFFFDLNSAILDLVGG